jgi:hypothetical protein
MKSGFLKTDLNILEILPKNEDLLDKNRSFKRQAKKFF